MTPINYTQLLHVALPQVIVVATALIVMAIDLPNFVHRPTFINHCHEPAEFSPRAAAIADAMRHSVIDRIEKETTNSFPEETLPARSTREDAAPA